MQTFGEGYRKPQSSAEVAMRRNEDGAAAAVVFPRTTDDDQEWARWKGYGDFTEICTAPEPVVSQHLGHAAIGHDAMLARLNSSPFMLQ